MKKAKLKSKMVEAANRVWKAFMAFGPVDDGRPEGDEFDAALMEMRRIAKQTTHQTSTERAVLVSIVNAADENPEPCHYKIREAIQHGRMVLSETDLVVEE